MNRRPSLSLYLICIADTPWFEPVYIVRLRLMALYSGLVDQSLEGFFKIFILATLCALHASEIGCYQAKPDEQDPEVVRVQAAYLWLS